MARRVLFTAGMMSVQSSSPPPPIDFPTRMTALARALDREPAEALALAEALERDLLAPPTTDPVQLGRARDYRIRALYRLGRHAEGAALLLSPPPRTLTISAKNAAWLHSVGAEMALRAGLSEHVRRLIGRALELRIRDRDAEGCRLAVGTGFALLDRCGPDEVAAWLDHVEAQIEATGDYALKQAMAAALADVVAAPGFGAGFADAARRQAEWALQQAAEAGRVDEVRRLLAEGVRVDARNPGMPGLPTPLLAASFEGHAAVVEELLARGADVSARNVQGRTALHLAADQGHALIVAMLSEAGAPLDAIDFQGQTALHLAAWQDHRDSVRVLLSAGARMSVRDRCGDTALALAATEPVPEVVRMLCRAGADVEAVNHYGQTPLMRAAMAGEVEVAEALLEAGADPTMRDYAGRTALDWARAEGKRQVARLLRRHLRARKH
ncbi:MAG TPA: ankyrin repeat domain-containing protein [Nannocystis sp.]